ncbi:hypothetical protein GCM10027440_39000 [Nocardiopsis coralliicola]
MREDGVEQATLIRRTAKDHTSHGAAGLHGTGHPAGHGGMVPASAMPREPGPAIAPIGLTEEEIQLLAEIATGVTTDVAARRLELSARTLRRRLRAICDQLGVNTPIEAVVWAARKQLI